MKFIHECSNIKCDKIIEFDYLKRFEQDGNICLAKKAKKWTICGVTVAVFEIRRMEDHALF